ncbi:hypothetical protein KIW84_053885 [Lathyrus oleraceus]|uniref:Uncharacterized protein n=1 Tax=Pisum sativum TaxID=3888 RepID=A0A9D4WTW2_PEA|nr:hypothetical protein KIW84_053885 [Pisum sativum]
MVGVHWIVIFPGRRTIQRQWRFLAEIKKQKQNTLHRADKAKEIRTKAPDANEDLLPVPKTETEKTVTERNRFHQLTSNQIPNSINIPKLKLQKKNPSILHRTASLTTLDLGNNQLNGSIPDKLVELSELQCLVLSHNYLSGSIPSKESSYFRQLTVPDLSFVQHLGVSDLSHNRLSGTIPDELGSCVVVVDLLLNNNMLSGSVPRSLSRLTNLTTLDLSGNLLSGSIPTELGDAVTLQGLYLGHNQLSGTIPGSFGKLTGLVKLNLTGNMLFSSIPISIWEHEGVNSLGFEV